MEGKWRAIVRKKRVDIVMVLNNMYKNKVQHGTQSICVGYDVREVKWILRWLYLLHECVVCKITNMLLKALLSKQISTILWSNYPRCYHYITYIEAHGIRSSISRLLCKSYFDVLHLIFYLLLSKTRSIKWPFMTN